MLTGSVTMFDSLILSFQEWKKYIHINSTYSKLKRVICIQPYMYQLQNTRETTTSLITHGYIDQHTAMSLNVSWLHNDMAIYNNL